MKTLLFVLLLITSATGEILGPDRIIPKFYELLMQKENPSEIDEVDFFGNNEYIAKAIRLKSGYSESTTPVWDFLRINRSFFITKGVVELKKARIHFSAPFHTTRLWNQTVSESKKIYATFPTEVTANGASSGTSLVIFALGKSCYIDIGDTLVSGSLKPFSDQVYERAKRSKLDAE
jgi:hypothetical protein